MKYNRICFILALVTVLGSCGEKTSTTTALLEEEPIKTLPFIQIDLKDLYPFQKTTNNWQLMGDVYVDRTKDKTLSGTTGTGVLVNLPEEGMNQNLFANFEHGDMELELDVMVPAGSNSGLYFQGRYEIQLLDSWGVKEPQHSDIGGIYQRWDDAREEGKRGFEGHPPQANASKTPGLWQHFKIIFHAPKFDGSGTKIKNAWFEEVRLNGMLIHENVEVLGPTRAAAFDDEKPMGPFMIQGDHGPIALRNIKYKLYEDKEVYFSDMTMKEYESTSVMLPNLDSLIPVREIETDSISSTMALGERPSKILMYTGMLNIPDSGDYIFDFKVNRGGGLLLIDKDTIVNLDGDYNLDSLGFGKIALQKGKLPFALIYNKHRPWTRGFGLYVEGPGLQKHPLHSKGSLDLNQGKPSEEIFVEVLNEPIAQRSFLMHEGRKRTHCISIGHPLGIHYSYDLALGSLLQVWNGDFIDVTQMWHSRGEKQLGVPIGFKVSSHGDQEFTFLGNDKAKWPNSLTPNGDIKQMGYEFDANGIPTFIHKIKGTTITNTFAPSSGERGLVRTISTDGKHDIWHKIGEGEEIKKLPDGTYVINNESFFIDFSGNESLKPVIRDSNGKMELVLKIPAGKQDINYSIIW